VGLLSVDFLKLVIVAFFVAAPLAWLAMHKWLQAYPYRVDIQWWVFLVAALLAMGIALFTVGYQALRAALSSPARSLRSE
jgi:putative ABC transport system permease protein